MSAALGAFAALIFVGALAGVLTMIVSCVRYCRTPPRREMATRPGFLRRLSRRISERRLLRSMGWRTGWEQVRR